MRQITLDRSTVVANVEAVTIALYFLRHGTVEEAKKVLCDLRDYMLADLKTEK